MKPLFVRSAAVAILGFSVHAVAATHFLRVDFLPHFGGTPLRFDSLTNQIPAGQSISVTRLDFLLSNIGLCRDDGTWIGPTNWFAYLSLREGRTGFELNSIPSGEYRRLRFQIGLPPAINHADPSQFPPGHPLSPTVNGLHWNWQGGYVFLAMEGGWREPSGNLSGYSFHIATDRQLMTVELPVPLNLTGDRELGITVDIERIVASEHMIPITDATSSTHSRDNDQLADQLRENIERAFGVASLCHAPLTFAAASATNNVEIAPDATPYRLAISRFFPQPALPLDNPLTEEGVRLGALLFFDPRLSLNNSQSCASCHHPKAAFTDPGRAASRGAEGHVGTRNSMPLFNLAWKSSFFWDGRAGSLREQVLQPIQNPVEMHETLEHVVCKLKSARVNFRHEARALETIIRTREATTNQSLLTPAATNTGDYSTLFARAFGTPDITADRVARALEQFLLIQASQDSKFDRSLKGQAQLTDEEKRGFELFHTEYDPRRGQFGADCFHCHGGPLFQSQSFANNGLDSDFKDLGRYLITKRDGDKGKFSVPSLRNVAITAPYMHDGRFKTLEQVIEHYSGGVKRSPTLDPNLAKHPQGGVPLSAADKQAIVAFLKTLTEERFTKLPP